jgi:hypothetical protein
MKKPIEKKPLSGDDPDNILKKDPTTGVKNKVDTEPTIHEAVEEFATLEEQIDYIVSYDYSDEEELKEEIEAARAELSALSEAITVADRLKKRSTMRRFRNKIDTKRERATNKRASIGVSLKRARRKAIDMMKKRFAKVQNISDLPNSEKARIEKLVSKRKKAIDRLAKKLVRTVRSNESKRLMKNSF